MPVAGRISGATEGSSAKLGSQGNPGSDHPETPSPTRHTLEAVMMEAHGGGKEGR